MPRPKRPRAKRRKLKSASSTLPPPPPPPPPPSPAWVELPLEITANILQRVGVIEILVSAQRVCTTWWNVCRDDPSMWRVIEVKNNGVNIKADVLNKICRIAVDRSQGQLVKISIDNFGNKDLLYYIAQRSSGLRHLRLVRCYYIDDGCLAAAAKNFALLEELHVYLCNISSGFNKDDIEVIGHSCPLLKSFTLNAHGFLGYQCNDEALAVARNMPKVRHLALLGNVLTNEGLHAILDGCTHLESLDLRHCYNVDLEGDLGRCKQQIVDFKDPYDSTYGYEFHAQISDYFSPYEDYPDQITDSDEDFHWFSDTILGHGVYDDFNDDYD